MARSAFLTTLICLLTTISTLQAQTAAEMLRSHAVQFETPRDFELMVDDMNSRQLVLMGEASHGTSEYYVWRSELSKKLIEEKGFNFIVVEGDWPAFSKINEFVKHKPDGPETVEEAMDAIERWPHWMWRNHEVRELIVWLHEFNRDRSPDERAGLYGLDLYAVEASMEDVVNWFETIGSERAREANSAYSCLSRFSEIREYLMMINRTGENCSQDMESVLEMVKAHETDGTRADRWQHFNAKQNAKAVIQAEKHYRANLERGPASWNYRATHFKKTAERLLDYYDEGSRGIVWAHNTHIGDARATDMARHGMLNIGQLSREKWGSDQIYAIGFGSYTGRVLAARQWEGQMEVMAIPEARDESWEIMLADTGLEQFYLLFNNEEINTQLDRLIPHRAIGVTYQPEMDAQNNYTSTILPDRYNAFIFFRETDILDTID